MTRGTSTRRHAAARNMVLLSAAALLAGTPPAEAADPSSPIDQAVEALALRGIGPSVAGGRISDIEVHPVRRSTWYVGVGSGGVWKTMNAGTTWTPLFDDQPSYSIGEITLDPNDPEVVWVGTGENVSGRQAHRLHLPVIVA